MLKAPSVCNLEVIEHITVNLTSYSWKQSRIMSYACCLQGATYSFMTGVYIEHYLPVATFFSIFPSLAYRPFSNNRFIIPNLTLYLLLPYYSPPSLFPPSSFPL